MSNPLDLPAIVAELRTLNAARTQGDLLAFNKFGLFAANHITAILDAAEECVRLRAEVATLRAASKPVVEAIDVGGGCVDIGALRAALPWPERTANDGINVNNRSETTNCGR